MDAKEASALFDGEKAQLSVIFDHDDGHEVRAQNWLRGQIVLILRDEDEENGGGDEIFLGGEVQVSLVGKESTWISPQALFIPGCGPGRQYSTMTILEEEQIIDEVKPIIAGDNKKKAPKKHTFPFSFKLRNELPPTMSYESGENHGGFSVDYELISRIGGEAVTSRTITILGPAVSKQPSPVRMGPRIFPQLFFGLAAGFFALAVKVDNVNVGKGDNLTLAIACRNMSKVRAQRVDVTIVEEVSWNAGDHTKTDRVELGTYRDVKTPGISIAPISESCKATTTTTKENGGAYAPRAEGHVKEELAEAVELAENQVAITIPNRARDSYAHGKLIGIKHTLQVTLVVKEKPINPSLSTAIHIYDPPLSEQPKARRPTSRETAQLLQKTYTNEAKEPALWFSSMKSIVTVVDD